MRCGSGTRRPVRRSTAAVARISPSSTANARAPGRPRRRCASAPRNCPAPPTGAPTGAAFRDLLTEWKAAGRAAKDVDDALWQRFKAAQDTFFAARNAASAERDAEFRANADAKEALLAEAEKLDTSDLEAARAALRAIGDKWDAIGKVPRERGAELERRLRAVEKKVRDAPTAGVDPEAQARADQFRARAEQFERQAREGRGGRADQGRRGGPSQRRTVAAVGRRGRRGAWQEALGLLRPVVSSPVSSVSSSRRRPAGPSSAVRRPAVRRSSSAASCSGGARPHRARPVECQHDHRDPRDDQADARPRVVCGRGLPRPHRQQAREGRHRGSGQRDPRQRPSAGQQRQHREADAEHQRQPAEHPRRQCDRRCGSRRRRRPARPSPWRRRCAAARTSAAARNTRIATTNALAPGSISRATRRSAASMSPLNSSKSPLF